MADPAIVQRYEATIAPDAREVEAQLNALDAELMRGSLAERFPTKQQLGEMLLRATACLSFFAPKFYKTKAIRDGVESDRYVELKKATEARGEKFVSAVAEREAAQFVNELRYEVSAYQSNFIRCEQYVNTCKKLLETYETEFHAETT